MLQRTAINPEDRQLRQLLGNNIVYIDSQGRPNKRIVRGVKPAVALQNERRQALQGCDAIVILNELPYDDALAVFRRALAKTN